MSLDSCTVRLIYTIMHMRHAGCHPPCQSLQTRHCCSHNTGVRNWASKHCVQVYSNHEQLELRTKILHMIHLTGTRAEAWFQKVVDQALPRPKCAHQAAK